MAWFDKDNKPAAEITGKPAEAEKPAGDKPDPSESIAASLREFTQTMGAKLDEFGNRLSTVEAQTRKPEPPAEPREVPSVMENEDLAFAVRNAPLQMRQFELEARMVYGDIKREYERAGFGDMIEQFDAEIKQTLDGSPLVGADGKAVRGNPDYIRNVIDLIVGRYAKKQGMRFDGKNKVFFLETGGGDAGNTNSSAPNNGLSPEEVERYRRWGMSPDEAVKAKGSLKFTN